MRTDKYGPTVHTSPRNHTLCSPTKRPGSWFSGDFDTPEEVSNSVGGWKQPEEHIILQSYSRRSLTTPMSSGRPIELRPSSYHNPGQFWRQSTIPMSMGSPRPSRKPGSPYRPGRSTPRRLGTKQAAAAAEDEPVEPAV